MTIVGVAKRRLSLDQVGRLRPSLLRTPGVDLRAAAGVGAKPAGSSSANEMVAIDGFDVCGDLLDP